MNSDHPTVGVLIRFRNAAATLPGVLVALSQQTCQPDVILGVDSGSRDDSRALIVAAGGALIDWQGAYEHSAVLNFGLAQMNTDLVLVLSSQTVMEAPDTLERMVAALSDPRVACVSGRKNDDGYSDDIDWTELSTRGLAFDSIYSNRIGMIRRSRWQALPFDESLAVCEDYAWTLAQLKNGHRCRRLALPHSHRRSNRSQHAALDHVIFHLARHHGLNVAWPGPAKTLQIYARSLLDHSGSPASQEWRPAARRLIAWASQWLRPWHKPWAVVRR